MRRFIDFILKNPVKIIFVTFIIFIFFAFWIKEVKVDPDIMRALPKRIPERRYFDKITDIFP